MAQSFSDQLWEHIEQNLPAGASGDLLVALSGGLDSIALLHALAADETRRARVRAVHVNHQLHPDAARWQQSCDEAAHALKVAIISVPVTINERPVEGVEAAARRARYDVLRQTLAPAETLLTAHHADDQLETVLLALLRGSGVDGLAAMPRCRTFGEGWHLRPLLDFSRRSIEAWARQQRLGWLEDPSNDNLRFDRNYLRREVLPALRLRWPSAAQAAVRSAAHLGEAAGLLDEIAARDLELASAGPCLRVPVLKTLEPARRRNLLRHWLHLRGARPPTTRKLATLEHDMLAADDDRSPCVDWHEIEVRRHRGLLYCGPRLSVERMTRRDWNWPGSMRLPVGSGLLRAEIAHGRGLSRSKLPAILVIDARDGGEWLRLPGHAHHRQLKKLFQEANVLPWWRDRIPLVFAGDALVAVADLWISAEYAATRDEEGVVIVWDERPMIEGVAISS